jgi:hypothetical protein
MDKGFGYVVHENLVSILPVEEIARRKTIDSLQLEITDVASDTLEEMKRKLKKPISVDFQDNPIGDALQIMADQADLKITVSPGVTGNVTFTISEVQIGLVLREILAANGFGYVIEEGQVRVLPLEEITKKEAPSESDGDSVSREFASLPGIYRIVYDCVGGSDCYIDFDRGILYSTDHLVDKNAEGLAKWWRQKGIDAGVKWNESGKLGLFGIDFESVAVDGEDINRIVGQARTMKMQKNLFMEYDGSVGKYLFRTREGGSGILELKNHGPDRGVYYLRIRYKMPSMKGVVLSGRVGVVLSGRVLSEPGGQGVEGVPLVCQTGLGIGLYATTDAEGWYRFNPIEADEKNRSMNIWIEQEAQGPGTWRPGVRVDVADSDIRLEDICLSLPQSIRGTVRNSKTGDPVGAGVRINNNNSSVPMRSLRTDANGRYCFYVTPGSYKLVCMGSEDRYYGAYDSESREGKIRTVSVEAGQVVEGIDLEAEEAQAYSGVVELPDGQAVAGAEVFVRAQWHQDPNKPIIIDSGYGGPDYMKVRLEADERGRFVGYLRRPTGMPEREADELINIQVVARSSDGSMSGFSTVRTKKSKGVADPIRIVLSKSGSTTFRLIESDGRGIAKAFVRGEFKKGDLHISFAKDLAELIEDLGDGNYIYAKRSYLSGMSDWFGVEPGEQLDLGEFVLKSSVARR